MGMWLRDRRSAFVMRVDDETFKRFGRPPRRTAGKAHVTPAPSPGRPPDLARLAWKAT